MKNVVIENDDDGDDGDKDEEDNVADDSRWRPSIGELVAAVVAVAAAAGAQLVHSNDNMYRAYV